MRLRIRPATALDVDAAARTKAAAWREAYSGVLPDAVLEHQETDGALRRTAEAWAAAIAEGSHFWLVVDDDADGEVVGIAHAAPRRESDAPALLELTMIYLRERVKGSGVADSLLQHAVGDADAYLWVLRDNPRAHRFYEKHGFVADGGTRTAHTSHGDLDEVRMVRLAVDED